MANPLRAFLESARTMILDGALATELEGRGLDLNDSLWSARVLLEQPDAIREVHRNYLQAGADCLITASYQASVPGFAAHGIDGDTATEILQRSINLATDERDAFWADADQGQRTKPLVAASIGPYGAFLANGAEYTGNYGQRTAQLVDWHRSRWQLAATSSADILACETIPSAREADAYIELLGENPGTPAWMSFSCADGTHINDGTPIREVGQRLNAVEGVVAIGVNCTSPTHLTSLIGELRSVTDKPVIVYPNSGELYHPEDKSWSGTAHPEEYGQAALRWREAGASIIGGCCRTTPAHISQLRTLLTN